MHREHILNETKIVSTLNFTATKTGKLLCNASNDFGSSSYESTFLLTGKFSYIFYYVYTFKYLHVTFTL